MQVKVQFQHINVIPSGRERAIWIRNSDRRKRKQIPTIFWKRQTQDYLEKLSISGVNTSIDLLGKLKSEKTRTTYMRHQRKQNLG